jgi:plastin-1
VANGIILCKLIDKAQPGTIYSKAINVGNMNIFKVKENLNLAITSAKAIGCICVNVHPENILQKSEHIILGLIW